MMPVRSPVAAMPAPEVGKFPLQIGHQQVPLLGLEIFLHFQKVLDFHFFQADLEAADLLNLGLHRGPLRQRFPLEKLKEFPALLHQFLAKIPNLAPVLRNQAQKSLALLLVQVKLPHHGAKRQGSLLRGSRFHLPVLPAQINQAADGPQVQGQ
jgi:hypothetical protein